MKRLPIPPRFHAIAERLGIGVRHFINDYAIRDNYLGRHEEGLLTRDKDERDYLINIMVNRSSRPH